MSMTLKEARTKRDLTQAELAEIMGVSVAQISQWENGVNDMSTKKFYKLCKALRVSSDDIILPWQLR